MAPNALWRCEGHAAQSWGVKADGQQSQECQQLKTAVQEAALQLRRAWPPVSVFSYDVQQMLCNLTEQSYVMQKQQWKDCTMLTQGMPNTAEYSCMCVQSICPVPALPLTSWPLEA